MEPEKALNANQLINAVGGGNAQMQRELRNFFRSGLLHRHRVGNQILYQANPRHPLFPELHTIALKTVGLADVLRDALQHLPGIRVAFVYGSLARGEDSANSDIDIMLIGESGFSEVVGALESAQRMLDRELNPSVYSSHDFRARLETKSHFLSQVVAGPKIFIIGDADDLERMGGSA
jgi:predicted nucleotidyltransferase